MMRATLVFLGTGLLVLACGGKIDGDDAKGGTPGTSTTSTPPPGVVAPNACQKACPADPDPSDQAIAQCKSGKDPSGVACDTEYVAIINCAAGKVVCKGGRSDPEASGVALFGACSAAIAAYQTCVTKSLDADGGLRPPG